jgi:ketosteroid isomerase-like protein
MFCSKCGKEGGKESGFCKFCGAPLANSEVQAADVPGKRSRKRLWITLGAVGVVAIVGLALLLSLVVFRSNSASEAEKAVTGFITAFAEKDTNRVLSLLDPDTVQALEQQAQSAGASLQTLIANEMANVVPAGSTEITLHDPKFETTVNGDTASVQVLSVELTYRDPQGEMQTKDLSGPSSLVKKNGKWYITSIQVK